MDTITIPGPSYSFMDLPSNGNNPQQLTGIQIRPMTMKEEKLLYDKALSAKGLSQTKLLQAVIGQGTTKDGQTVKVDVNQLLLADEYAITLWLRSMSYGREYETTIECEKCGVETSAKWDLETDLPVKIADETTDKEITVRLPVSGKTVTLRYPTRADSDDNIFTIIKRVVKSIEGVQPELVSGFLDNLIARDSAELRKALEKVPFGPAEKVPFVCANPKCKTHGSVQEIAFPITRDFFRL